MVYPHKWSPISGKLSGFGDYKQVQQPTLKLVWPGLYLQSCTQRR